MFFFQGTDSIVKSNGINSSFNSNENQKTNEQQYYPEQVKVDTILIESDMVAKPILDLIPILQIKTLVIGANKFHLRYTTNHMHADYSLVFQH